MEDKLETQATPVSTFAEYERVLRFAKYTPGLIYPALALAGECGEFSEKVAKHFRDNHHQWEGYKVNLTDSERMAFKKELGDVLWNVAAAAREIGSSLEEVATANVTKLELRNSTNTIHGSGDNREEIAYRDNSERDE